MFGNFYFPDGTQPDWESLNWIQKEFMQWFNAERLRCMLTFPVESFALVYKNGEFVDKESAEFVAQEYARGHSFFTYISDTVDSLSSCCFSKDTKCSFRVEIDGETILMDFEQAYKKYSDRIVFIWNAFEEEYQEARIVRAKNIEDKEVNLYLEEDGIVKCTLDHIFLVKKGDDAVSIHAKDIQENDVLLKCFSPNAVCKKVEIKPSSGYYYCFQFIENTENPYFVLPGGLITHNCRLKNMVKTKEFNFTNGNIGVQTGSKSVITLNLNRITQDYFRTVDTNYFGNTGIIYLDITEEDMQGFQQYIINILERVYKYHIAYNELLWDMYNANLLPVYKAGFIDLNKQYLTIGINGLNQSAEFLGINCKNTDEYKKFCKFIFNTIKESNSKANGTYNEHKLSFNTELVPAESLAAKNYTWDQQDNYFVPKDINLYASYIFKPNDLNISVLDKLFMHGKNFANDQLDGGAAAHINLDHHLSVEQYRKLLKYAGEVGCQYFTFNIPNCECDKCGFIAKQPFKSCPKCGSTNISLWDRIIGYLSKIKNWSNPRQIEQKTRIYSKNVKV